jgi:hypothetical protein
MWPADNSRRRALIYNFPLSISGKRHDKETSSGMPCSCGDGRSSRHGGGHAGQGTDLQGGTRRRSFTIHGPVFISAPMAATAGRDGRVAAPPQFSRPPLVLRLRQARMSKIGSAACKRGSIGVSVPAGSQVSRLTSNGPASERVPTVYRPTRWIPTLSSRTTQATSNQWGAALARSLIQRHCSMRLVASPSAGSNSHRKRPRPTNSSMWVSHSGR